MSESATMNAAAAKHEPDLEDRTLVIERVFKASPEKVFAAWTDPAILVKWWGPEGTTTPEYRMDVRVGGAWRTKLLDRDGSTHTASGVYREISAPKRLAMTWAWEQADGSRGHETVLELSFEQVADGTRMRLVQRLFQSREQRENHNRGWTSSLNDLARLFE